MLKALLRTGASSTKGEREGRTVLLVLLERLSRGLSSDEPAVLLIRGAQVLAVTEDGYGSLPGSSVLTSSIASWLQGEDPSACWHGCFTCWHRLSSVVQISVQVVDTDPHGTWSWALGLQLYSWGALSRAPGLQLVQDSAVHLGPQLGCFGSLVH